MIFRYVWNKMAQEIILFELSSFPISYNQTSLSPVFWYLNMVDLCNENPVRHILNFLILDPTKFSNQYLFLDFSLFFFLVEPSYPRVPPLDPDQQMHATCYLSRPQDQCIFFWINQILSRIKSWRLRIISRHSLLDIVTHGALYNIYSAWLSISSQ